MDLIAEVGGRKVEVKLERRTDTEVTVFEMLNFGGSIGGELPVELPGGPVDFVVGFEFRDEEGENRPDPVVVAGESASNKVDPTSGSYDVWEYYAEVNLPLLADMPFVPPEHLSSVLSSAEIPGATCVMSNHNGVLSPPALFKREHFKMLSKLSGDRGAKAAFVAIEHGNRTVDLAESNAADIDITADLERALETTHA